MQMSCNFIQIQFSNKFYIALPTFVMCCIISILKTKPNNLIKLPLLTTALVDFIYISRIAKSAAFVIIRS